MDNANTHTEAAIMKKFHTVTGTAYREDFEGLSIILRREYDNTWMATVGTYGGASGLIFTPDAQLSTFGPGVVTYECRTRTDALDLAKEWISRRKPPVVFGTAADCGHHVEPAVCRDCATLPEFDVEGNYPQ